MGNGRRRCRASRNHVRPHVFRLPGGRGRISGRTHDCSRLAIQTLLCAIGHYDARGHVAAYDNRARQPGSCVQEPVHPGRTSALGTGSVQPGQVAVGQVWLGGFIDSAGRSFRSRLVFPKDYAVYGRAQLRSAQRRAQAKHEATRGPLPGNSWSSIAPCSNCGQMLSGVRVYGSAPDPACPVRRSQQS